MDYEPWLVDSKTYDSYYGTASENKQRLNATLAIIILVICCSGGFSYEKQMGTVYLIRSTKMGRKSTYLRKTALNSAMALFAWAIVYIRELFDFVNANGTETFAAPVYNISELSLFPFGVTLGGYLLLLYVVRLVMLICVAQIVLVISELTSIILTSYVVGFCILCIPALLGILGVGPLTYVSPMIPVSSAEIMWSLGNGSLTLILSWAIMIIVTIVVSIFGYRRWVKIG